MVRAASSQNSAISYIVGDATALNFSSNLFDVAIFPFNGIDCIPSPAKRIKALKEIKRVLKPGR